MPKLSTLSITLLLAAAAQAETIDAAQALENVRAGQIQAERALTVIALEAPVDAPHSDARVADVSDPEILIGTRGPERADRLMTRYDGDTLRVLVPGHVVENGDRSFAVTSYAVTSHGHVVELDVAQLTNDTEQVKPTLAFRTLPPTLRWMALTQPNSGELKESLAMWARRWNTPDDEDSLADLARAERMEKRVAMYVTPLRELRATDEDHEVVGYLARLGDDVAVIEVFGRAEDFATHWPSVIRALAVEAVLSERNEGWLSSAVHGDSTPEFGRTATDKMLRTLLDADFERERIHRDAVVLRTGDSNRATRMLTTLDGRLVHFVHTPDATRRTAPVFDQLDPADARTKQRDTGDVERMKARRDPPEPTVE